MSRPNIQNRPAFGVRDLLVVMLLVSLIVPLAATFITGRLRRSVSATWASNHLKQMGLAMHACHDVYKRCPPAFAGNFGPMKGAVSLHVHLLPYSEQNNLYNILIPDGQGKGNEHIVAPFTAPEDATAGDYTGVQNYAANLRVFSTKGLETPYNSPMPALDRIEPGEASIPRTFEKDGTSNVIVFTTKYAKCGAGGSMYAADPRSLFAAFFGQNPGQAPASATNLNANYQVQPNAKQCAPSPLRAQSFWSEWILVCLADASCRRVSRTISSEVWNRALQPNDGKVLPQNWSD